MPIHTGKRELFAGQGGEGEAELILIRAINLSVWFVYERDSGHGYKLLKFSQL